MDGKALHKLSYGLFVVASGTGDTRNGQIANAVFQVTSEPPQIALAINKKNLTHEYLEASRVFSVSILSVETPMPFIGAFGFRCGRDVDKFAGVAWKKGVTGAPVVLDHAVGYLEGRIVGRLDCGTHTLFVGVVEDGSLLSEEDPMTYDHYRRIKGGKAPKTAPTYVREDEPSRSSGS